MKKLLLFIPLIFSCQELPLLSNLGYPSDCLNFRIDQKYLDLFKNKYWNYETQDKKGLCSDIEIFVNSYINYELDEFDYWKKPSDTWNEKKGDCEDKALLFCNIYYSITHNYTDLYLVDYKTTEKRHIAIYNSEIQREFMLSNTELYEIQKIECFNGFKIAEFIGDVSKINLREILK